MRELALWLSSIALAALAGCSALAVEPLPRVGCTADADCVRMNVRYQLPTGGCTQYQCNEATRFCERRERRDDDEDGDPPTACGGTDCDDTTAARLGDPARAREECDGVDNDCDQIVDEDAITAAAAQLAVGLGTPERVVYASSDAATVAMAVPTSTSASAPFVELGDASGGAPSARAATFRRSAVDLTRAWYNVVETEVGCPGDGCTYRDLAIADLGDERFVVAVSGGGCAAGQVRVGHAVATGEPATILRGPRIRSNVLAGVDLDASGCTGASRAGAPGAARPAVAAIPDPEVPQALAAWLGDAVSRDRCGGASVPVEALVLWLEHASPMGTRIGWVTASDDGTPVVLGTTTGGGAPAIAASPDGSGFVAAFGSARGIELRYVARAPSPRPVVTTDDPDATRPTPPMMVSAETSIAGGGSGAPDHVSIAMGTSSGTSLELGVTWTEGCGTADEQVWFSRVVWSGTGFSGSTPVRLSTERTSGRASVIGLDHEIVTPELELDGESPGDRRGWLIAWPEMRGSGALVARRVLRDGRVLDAVPFELDAPTALPRDVALVDALGPTGIASVVYSLGGAELFGGAICGVR